MDTDDYSTLKEKLKELGDKGEITEINMLATSAITLASKPMIDLLVKIGDIDKNLQKLFVEMIAEALIVCISNNFDEAYSTLETIKKRIINTEKDLRGK